MSSKEKRLPSTDIARAFDVPVWLLVGQQRPRLFRLRWALRRFTGWDGSRREASREW